ncbi:O-acetyl-ADP-ribose deacetylase (regulator of RNase III), contains Macro domain [Kytococcus aerolatus]|uniref:O-acetyl-ADP-ribose deacetylase (Regulator of RNase III), contains Macro domain n=1 Tax=Kytococcus aerolatus TaxID=592308 RepID=A0A212U4U2_9MICO|nr:O-acetyl-ADP-ribose deacetylase [Kytococcus aerolatus]SNC73278.1 O-acetyl-ADP-ribose deacetylase (regulator of RNase III), contains Macro domain [Kytococcus aerolatus]
MDDISSTAGARVRIECVQGDITTQEVDAIVNAANSSLLGGGGVDGAIHRAAGPALLAECRELRASSFPGGLAVGEAVATGAGDLPARWVVHTVGPNRGAGQTDPALLRAAFASSLRVADGLGATSVALPAVGAGVYGWSAEDAAREAMTATREFVAAGPVSVHLVRFVLFSPELLAAFEAAQG